jgi:hypothetical protein
MGTHQADWPRLLGSLAMSECPPADKDETDDTRSDVGGGREAGCLNVGDMLATLTYSVSRLTAKVLGGASCNEPAKEYLEGRRSILNNL